VRTHGSDPCKRIEILSFSGSLLGQEKCSATMAFVEAVGVLKYFLSRGFSHGRKTYL
jgi:hypothetical protein